MIPENAKLKIIAPELDERKMMEHAEYIIQEIAHQTFTVIDNQIVGCGNINPLSYNRKLTKELLGYSTLFD